MGLAQLTNKMDPKYIIPSEPSGWETYDKVSGIAQVLVPQC